MIAGGNIAVDATRQSFWQWVVWVLVGAAGGCATTVKESRRDPKFSELDSYVDVTVGSHPDECFTAEEAAKSALANAMHMAARRCPLRIFVYDSVDTTGYDADTRETKGGGCYITSLRFYFRCKEPTQ